MEASEVSAREICFANEWGVWGTVRWDEKKQVLKMKLDGKEHELDRGHAMLLKRYLEEKLQ